MSRSAARRPHLSARLRLDPMECRVTPSHTVSITAPSLTGPEGTSVALTSTVTGATTPTYDWSVTKDGAPFATATTADFNFTPDDNGTYVVTLTVADGQADATGAHTATATATFTATNVAPTATVSGPAVTVPGLPTTFTLGATDPSAVDQAAGFTFRIDWDGNGTVDETVTGPAGTTATHTFTGNGATTVRVTAVDKDGGESTPATQAVAVKTAALVDDPLNPGKKLLAVGGTDGADAIHLIPGGRAGSIKVKVGGSSVGAFSGAGRIAVFGLGGADDIHLAGAIRTSAWLDGGAGDDRLKGAKGADVLLGGDGADQMDGSQGADILIGGAGADRLLGGPGDDLLIAGTTAYDANPTALDAIAEVWAGGGSVAARVQALRTSATVPLVMTGTSATVLDDGAADLITGAAGGAWVFADPEDDQITGAQADLFVNDTVANPGNGNGNGNGNGGGHGHGHGGGKK